MASYTFSVYNEDRSTSITFEAESMVDIVSEFRTFMLASGFVIDQEEYFDLVRDDQYDDPITLNEINSYDSSGVDFVFDGADASYHAGIDPFEYTISGIGDSDTDALTINLSDTYGATTTKLKPSEK